MTQIYSQAISKAASFISKSTDRELCNENCNTVVFNSAKIDFPRLNLEQTKVQIKQEEISFSNAPRGIGISISGNKIVECAIYNTPVIGDRELFSVIVRPYIDRQKTYVENDKFL